METRGRQNQQRLGHVRMLRERSWTKPRERERGNQSEGEEEAGEECGGWWRDKVLRE